MVVVVAGSTKLEVEASRAVFESGTQAVVVLSRMVSTALVEADDSGTAAGKAARTSGAAVGMGYVVEDAGRWVGALGEGVRVRTAVGGSGGYFGILGKDYTALHHVHLSVGAALVVPGLDEDVNSSAVVLDTGIGRDLALVRLH